MIKSTLNFARTAPREVHETEKRDIQVHTESLGADPRALGDMLIHTRDLAGAGEAGRVRGSKSHIDQLFQEVAREANYWEFQACELECEFFL